MRNRSNRTDEGVLQNRDTKAGDIEKTTTTFEFMHILQTPQDKNVDSTDVLMMKLMDLMSLVN